METVAGGRPLFKRLMTLGMCLAISAATLAEDWPAFRGNAQHTGAITQSLPENLELLWSRALPEVAPAWLDQPRLQFDSAYQPIIASGILVLASQREDCVVAYNLENGAELWRFFAGGPFRLPPAAANGKVYAGSDDGYLYTLDLKTGNLIWKMKGVPKDRLVLGNARLIDTWPVRGGPVVADGKVYFAAGLFPFMGVFVHCLDAETGKVIWTNSGDGAAYLTQPHGAKSFSGIAPQGALAIAGERLLIPNGRAVCASYDRETGKMQYFSFASKFGGHDVVVSGEYFFNGGLVYDLATGKTAGTAIASPVIAGGIAYGLSKSGIVALDLDTPVDDSTSILKKLKGPSAKFKTFATVPFDDGKCLLAAGRILFAGGENAISAFTLPLSDKSAPKKIPVKGTVENLIAGGGKLIAITEKGELLCFGSGSSQAKLLTDNRTAPTAAGDEYDAVLNDAGIKNGYALILGADAAPVAHALLAKTSMDIVIIEPDAAKVAALRTQLLGTGSYGDRVAVIAAPIQTAPLPSYFASLIVASESASKSGASMFANAYRALHPYHGKAYFKLNEKSSAELTTTAAQWGQYATIKPTGTFTKLSRIGGVPGSGNWTHEHADAGNSRVSKDKVVRAPLGVLWWGGSSHDGILPRHGHGPQPQVVDGHLIIEGMDMLRAMDIYTGRVLWETSLPGVGSYYNNTVHHFGANATGTNFISTSEGVYVAIDRKCVVLDLDTGKVKQEFTLPDAAAPNMVWGYINVVDDYLIAGAGVPRKEKPPEKLPIRDDHDDDDHDDDTAAKGPVLPRTVSSKLLIVFDRKSGKKLWTVEAENEFRHNGICAGNSKVFAIDRPTPELSMKSKSPTDLADGTILKAFDLQSGKKIWQCNQEVFGTWLSYSDAFDVLVESGRRARDTLFDEAKGMRAFQGITGKVLWQDLKATGPAMIRGKTVLKEKSACDLFTGKPLMIADPISGTNLEWTWTRMYGCNTPAASENLLTFRSGAAGFYDLNRFGGTGNFGGFRSSCTHNLVVAGGILCAPDYTRTCICSYQLQTSVALIPDSDVEMWTYTGSTADVKNVLKLGVNFGAWGDRLDDDGTQWLEYPSTGGPSQKIKVTTEPSKPETFVHHSMLVSGAKPWVTASGVIGLKSLDLSLNEKTERVYTVRLYFAEPSATKAGDRVMSISLQGKPALTKFDVFAEAGGANRSVVKEIKGVRAGESLKVELTAHSGTTLLCGLEVIAEGKAPAK